MTKPVPLQTIISIFTVTTVLFTLIAAGVAINNALNTLYMDQVTRDFNHSLSTFQSRVSHSKSDLESALNFTSKDELMVSLAYFISEYQSEERLKNSLDGEKKKAALILRPQLQSSSISSFAFYSKNGDLIAYAIRSPQAIRTGIVSKAQETSSIQEWETENFSRAWRLSNTKPDIPLSLHLLEQFESRPDTNDIEVELSENGSIKLQRARKITRGTLSGKPESVGFLLASAHFDSVFFENLSHIGRVNFSLENPGDHLVASELRFAKPNRVITDVHIDSNSLTDMENKVQAVFLWPTANADRHLTLSANKEELTKAISTTADQLIYMFVLLAISMISIGIFVLNHFIRKPIFQLIDSAKQPDSNKNAGFPLSKINKECADLGQVLNTMVGTISKREQELSQSETQLRNSQRMAKLGSWEIDHVADNIKWSDETYRLFNLDPRHFTPTSDSFLKLVPIDEREALQNALMKAISQKTPFDKVHHVNINTGETLTVRAYSETSYDGNGQPLITHGMVQDITEQTQKDEQLRRSQKMDALGKLTGGIAHDFNNVLTIIMGFSSILRHTLKKDTEEYGYVTSILTAGERASKLTSKLLSFARTEPTAPDLTDINALLESERNMLEKTLTPRIQIKYELAENIWPLKLEQSELQDALLNMCINSMHAMPDGGHLIVSTQNVELSEIDASSMGVEKGKYVLLCISDTGVGMTPDEIQHIFDPFFTTKGQKGTGLGMTQVYGFVQRSRGAIKIFSQPNQGTRVSVFLPQAILDKPEYNSIAPETMGDSLAGDETILVIDDEKDLRCLEYKILNNAGYRVLTAESGEDALKILERESVDLVISDIIMPNMDGYQVAYLIQSKFPDLPIQLVSGFTEEQVGGRNEQLYRSRLQKPFDSVTLLTRVRELFAEKRQPINEEKNTELEV